MHFFHSNIFKLFFNTKYLLGLQSDHEYDISVFFHDHFCTRDCLITTGMASNKTSPFKFVPDPVYRLIWTTWCVRLLLTVILSFIMRVFSWPFFKVSNLQIGYDQSVYNWYDAFPTHFTNVSRVKLNRCTEKNHQQPLLHYRNFDLPVTSSWCVLPSCSEEHI